MGSEMCIRDSPRLDHGGTRHGIDADDSLELGERDENAVAMRHRACLLYTSDAADERSSVDLGGRRIIKKKNQQVDPE